MANTPKRRLISAAFLEHSGAGRTIRDYRNKEVVYLQGSPADSIFYLQNGMVKLTVASKLNRKKAVLGVLQEGDFFGEGCLGRQRKRIATATSMGPSTVTRVERDTFRARMDQDAAFAAMFTEYLLAQVARFQEDLADHFLNFSERRLARILLMYRGFSRKSDSGPSILGFSQTTLAELVGTTRSRINSFMNEFREKGYVRYNGGLEIDTKRLTIFLEG